MTPTFRQERILLSTQLWIRLESIQEICDSMEEEINRKLKEIDGKQKIVADLEDENEKNKEINKMIEDYHLISNWWPQIIRESFFLALGLVQK